jgi:hypothetical protein
LLDDTPAKVLQLWKLYITQEPRGDRRGDWQAAQVSKAIHDVALGFNGHSNPSALDDYLLQFELIDRQTLLRNNLRIARGIFGKVVPNADQLQTDSAGAGRHDPG